MAAEEKVPLASPSQSPSPPLPSSASGSRWKETILFPTLLAGFAGGVSGMLSKHRGAPGLGNVPAMYAANFAIVAGCYCGAREYVREVRASKPDDLLNSVAGGIISGALLGRLQGGRVGAVKYAILFTAVGTTFDYSMVKIRPVFKQYGEAVWRELKWPSDWKKMPEWSPIQILDEEALARRRDREQQLYLQRMGKLKKEES